MTALAIYWRIPTYSVGTRKRQEGTLRHKRRAIMVASGWVTPRCMGIIHICANKPLFFTLHPSFVVYRLVQIFSESGRSKICDVGRKSFSALFSAFSFLRIFYLTIFALQNVDMIPKLCKKERQQADAPFAWTPVRRLLRERNCAHSLRHTNAKINPSNIKLHLR